MRQWLITNFKLLKHDKINDLETVETEFDSEKIAFVLDNFINYFGEDAPTAVEDLKTKDPNDEKGFHKIFDHWKQQGILN